MNLERPRTRNKTYFKKLSKRFRLMKKHYKPKQQNVTKLKSYLSNADKNNNTRNIRSSSPQHNGIKRNNIH